MKGITHRKDDLQPKTTARAGTTSVSLAWLLAGEIAVGTVINIVFNLFFAWLFFYGRTPVGRDAILVDTIPAAFIPALLMTFPVTFLMRKRMRYGLTVTHTKRLPFFPPQTLLLRAPGVAMLALALVALPVTVLLWISWGSDWNWGAIVVFKIAFSAFHAAMLTPIVVMAALTLDHRTSAVA